MAIKKGDKVRVDYEGRFESGEVFDTSMHGDHSHPLEFEVGAGQMIAGFDSGVIGLNIGDEKEITLKPNDAYGEYNPKLVQKIPLRKMPAGAKLEEGMELYVKTPDGNQLPVKIKKIIGDMVEIDLNHPMAGKTLIFKIIIKSINEEGDLSEHDHHDHHEHEEDESEYEEEND